MTPDALMECVAAQFDEIGQVNVGNCELLDTVYTDFGFDSAEKSSEVRIPVAVPVTAVKTTGMGYVAPTFDDYQLNYVSMKLDTQLHHGINIPNIDKINTDQDVAAIVVEPSIAAIAEGANGVIAAALNATNFSLNPVISTTASIITTKQFVKGRTALVNRKCRGVYDPRLMTFVMHPTVNGEVSTDDAWTKASSVGDVMASEIRTLGKVTQAFGSKLVEDQQMKATGTDPNQLFTSALYSKYALAVALRPVPLGDEKVVRARYVQWKNLTIAVQLSYSGKEQKYFLSVDLVMGCKPVRPEYCQLFSTAQ